MMIAIVPIVYAFSAELHPTGSSSYDPLNWLIFHDISFRVPGALPEWLR